MNTTMINIKSDASLKHSAQKVAEELGLPLSVIVNNYLRRLVVERRVDFVAPLTPNKETAKTLDEIVRDTDAGKNLSPAFTTAEDAIAWLKK